MDNALFPLHIFPTIEYYAYLAQTKHCLFEAEDHYQKQTYRNRYSIYSASGKLDLTIPIQHNANSRFYKDTHISYDTNWQRNHLKSLQSAYQSSPFFEYYIDDLIPLFNLKEKYLMDFNVKAFNRINTLIELSKPIQKTTEYSLDSNQLNLREKFKAKNSISNQKFEPYIQVFSNEKGFIENLSILDLLFNEGPNALNYLEKLKLS